MNKSSLLAATAVLALTAGNVSAGSRPTLFVKPVHMRPVLPTTGVLYSQNSNFGDGINSQNYTSGSFGTAYNDAAADDFVVPAGHTWTITALDVTGALSGSGPATSEVVTFYGTKCKRGHCYPGKVKHSYNLSCIEAPQAGSAAYSCTLPKKPSGTGLKLKPGTYWLSFVVNCSLSECGYWYWAQNTVTHNNPGQWENPGGAWGTGCNSWNNTSTCIPVSGIVDDYAFDLIGTST